MNILQANFNTFIESICSQYGCKDAIKPLQEGFGALCESAFGEISGKLNRHEYTTYNGISGRRVYRKPFTEITKEDIENQPPIIDIDAPDLSREYAVKWLSNIRNEKQAEVKDGDIRIISSTPYELIYATERDDNTCIVDVVKIVPFQKAGESVENDPEWNMHPDERKQNRYDRWARTSEAVLRNRKKIPQEIVQKVKKFAENMGWNATFEEDMDGRGSSVGDGFVFKRILASNAVGPDDVDSEMIDALMNKLGFSEVRREVTEPEGIDQTQYEYVSYIYKDSKAHVHPDADDFYYERKEHPGDPDLQNFENYAENRQEERANSMWGY